MQDTWRQIAKRNTKTYQRVFGRKVDPPYSVDSYARLKEWKVYLYK